MPACAGCNEELSGNHLEALDKHWHPKCFGCAHCSTPIGGDAFTIYENKPYHEACYEKIRDHIVCYGCEVEVEPGNQYITAMEHTWHHPCFTCVYCVKPFSDNLFYKYVLAPGLPEQPCHKECKPNLDNGEAPGRLPKSWKDYLDKKKAEEEEERRRKEEEEARRKKEEEERLKREEEERRKREEEERLKREAEEAERRRQQEEEDRKKREAEEADRLRKEEEERKKREEEEAERRRLEEEARRKRDEEERLRREEEERKARDAKLPKCTACQEPIRESSHRIYGDKAYHFECFKCAGCSKPLESDGPFPFKHEKLWHDDCVPRNNCGKCEKRIDGTELNAMGKFWHPECFVCCKCGNKFTTAFKLKDGQPIHTECL